VLRFAVASSIGQRLADESCGHYARCPDRQHLPVSDERRGVTPRPRRRPRATPRPPSAGRSDGGRACGSGSRRGVPNRRPSIRHSEDLSDLACLEHVRARHRTSDVASAHRRPSCVSTVSHRCSGRWRLGLPATSSANAPERRSSRRPARPTGRSQRRLRERVPSPPSSQRLIRSVRGPGPCPPGRAVLSDRTAATLRIGSARSIRQAHGPAAGPPDSAPFRSPIRSTRDADSRRGSPVLKPRRALRRSPTTRPHHEGSFGWLGTGSEQVSRNQTRQAVRVWKGRWSGSGARQQVGDRTE